MRRITLVIRRIGKILQFVVVRCSATVAHTVLPNSIRGKDKVRQNFADSAVSHFL